jgi:hypothetical protein
MEGTVHTMEDTMEPPIAAEAETSHNVATRAPRTHDSQDSQPLPTDSMVTVPLSETDGTHTIEHEEHDAEEELATLQRPDITIDDEELSSRPTSSELLSAIREPDSRECSPRSSMMDNPTISLAHELEEEDTPVTPTMGDRPRSNSGGSNESAHVDWAELEKAEEQEPEGAGQDNVTFLSSRSLFIC